MKNKMLAVFMFMILAFSVAGASYAIWTSSVTITGTATMGNIEFVIYDAVVVDDAGAAVGLTLNPPDKNQLIITLDNICPGDDIRLNVIAKNRGTLPCKYEQFLVSTERDTFASYFTLSFYDPSNNPNVVHDIAEWESHPDPWTDEGILDVYITLQPGQTQDNVIGIKVDENIPIGYMGETLEITITWVADLAI